MLFVEWSRLPIHTLTFTESTRIPPFGFRTYFQFDQEAVSALQAQGNASGMSRFEAWSDTVFIDIDNDPSAVTAFKEYFQKQNTAFSMWESGGKGVHFHIPTPLYHHKRLPQVHQKLMTETGIPCDMSLYRHNSLFRLPGTRHQKTKRVKTLISDFPGTELTIPDSVFEWADKVSSVPRIHLQGPQVTEIEQALLHAVHFAINEPPQGKRYMSLWSLGRACAEAGFSEDFTGELLEVINDKWCNPKEKEEVERAILDAYRCSTS